MATLLQLCDRGQLVPLDPELGPSSMEERFVYLLPRAKSWFEEVLPTAESSWNIEERPIEQIDALMEIFCGGEPLIIGRMFKSLVFHDAVGIWELKTADVRLFGWFPKKDHFVTSACGLTEDIKQHNLYHGYCTQAQRDRNSLDLDEPKFIAGGNPNDVVSNWSAP